MNSSRLSVFIFFVVFVVASRAAITCLDESGNAVDWFVTIKFPWTDNSVGGMKYAYADARQPQLKLATSRTLDQGSAVWSTLQQLYDGAQTKVAHLMYNDDPKLPDQDVPWASGHMKGAVALDAKSGFWLVHSVPGFPTPKADGLAYPSTGKKYGQHFLCLSLPAAEFDDVGLQLYFDRVNVFDSNVPKSLSSLLPNFIKAISVINGTAPNVRSRISNHTSLGGVEFTSFAKSPRSRIELYTNMVAPFFGESLRVQSWQNPPGTPFSHNCTPRFDVLDVGQLSYYGVNYSSSIDHSKWAVSVSPQAALVCFGDINRMSGQLSRGGGTVCQRNRPLWNSMTLAITAYSTNAPVCTDCTSMTCGAFDYCHLAGSCSNGLCSNPLAQPNTACAHGGTCNASGVCSALPLPSDESPLPSTDVSTTTLSTTTAAATAPSSSTTATTTATTESVTITATTTATTTATSAATATATATTTTAAGATVTGAAQSLSTSNSPALLLQDMSVLMLVSLMLCFI